MNPVEIRLRNANPHAVGDGCRDVDSVGAENFLRPVTANDREGGVEEVVLVLLLKQDLLIHLKVKQGSIPSYGKKLL